MTELYLYQTVHLARGIARNAEAHIAVLDTASRELFGRRYAPGTARLAARIEALAAAERYPTEVSGFVRIELGADGEERLVPAGVSLYDGYAFRSLQPEAVTLCYDNAPLFAVAGHTVLAAPGTKSVERELTVQAVRAAGLELREEPFGRRDLPHIDELFFADHRGITALARCDGQPLMTLIAERISSRLESGF